MENAFHSNDLEAPEPTHDPPPHLPVLAMLPP